MASEPLNVILHSSQSLMHFMLRANIFFFPYDGEDWKVELPMFHGPIDERKDAPPRLSCGITAVAKNI